MWQWTYDNWTSGVVWNIVVGSELLKAVNVCWVEPGNMFKSTGVEYGPLWTPKTALLFRFAALLDAKEFPSIYYNIDSQAYEQEKQKIYVVIMLSKLHRLYTSTSKETRLRQSVC